jgi:phage repressor protein C with HTH and peptisase S24 domain
MPKFGQTIARLRHAKGWDQRALATACGLGFSTIGRIETLASANIQPANYARLARALGMSPEELDREWRSTRIEQTQGDHGIPLINLAPAGDIIDYEEFGVDSGQGYAYLPRGDMEDPNAFAVKIIGDSMMPALAPGDNAIFSPNKYPPEKMPDGVIYFIRFSPDSRYHGCTVARAFREPDNQVLLIKDNPSYARRRVRSDEIIRMSALVRLIRDVKGS